MPNRNQLQNQMMNNSTSPINDEELIAKLSTIGSVIQTIGGVISTTASIMALQKFQRDIILQEVEDEGENVQSGNDDRISNLEKQIQFLINEIEQLKAQK